MLLRAALIWLCILILANINGAVREFGIIPHTGPRTGHLVSTLLLCAIIAAVAWLSIRWIGPPSPPDALGVGLLWLGLTLAFEFLAGRYLFHKPWGDLLADYNLAAGRIWILVPIVTLLSPEWARRFRTRATQECPP